jgi:hypothetical protein
MPDLAAMTPVHSEPSEPSNSPTSAQGAENQFDSLPRVDNDNELNVDMDMDMDMDETDFDFVGSPPPDSPAVHAFRPPQMRPAMLNPSLFDQDSGSHSTARIPTPMYPSFPATSRTAPPSSISGGGYPSSGIVCNTLLNVPKNPILQTPPISKKKHAYIEQQDRNHRMPSPISEDEDLPDTPTAFAQSKLSRLTVASSIPENMEVEDAQRGPESPGITRTPTTGRKRSGALSSRGRFSIGFRDDCEKCRHRVPGHFAHFIS